MVTQLEGSVLKGTTARQMRQFDACVMEGSIARGRRRLTLLVTVRRGITALVVRLLPRRRSVSRGTTVRLRRIV
jgi:hypothetical protein